MAETRIPEIKEVETYLDVETFNREVILQGIEKLTAAQRAKVDDLADGLFKHYGSLTLVPETERGPGSTYYQVATEYKRLRDLKPELNLGGAIAWMHANKVAAEHGGQIEPEAVLRSVWGRVRETQAERTHIRKNHAEKTAGYQAKINRCQEILDIYDEKGLNDPDSRQIYESIKSQRDNYQKDMDQEFPPPNESRMRDDINYVLRHAELATKVLQAGANIPEESIQETKRLIEE